MPQGGVASLERRGVAVEVQDVRVVCPNAQPPCPSLLRVPLTPSNVFVLPGCWTWRSPQETCLAPALDYSSRPSQTSLRRKGDLGNESPCRFSIPVARRDRGVYGMLGFSMTYYQNASQSVVRSSAKDSTVRSLNRRDARETRPPEALERAAVRVASAATPAISCNAGEKAQSSSSTRAPPPLPTFCTRRPRVRQRGDHSRRFLAYGFEATARGV